MHKTSRTARSNPYLEQANESARSYQRQRHLPALLALWPVQIEDTGLRGTMEIISRLEKALQSERRRGRATHWCYDLNRHLALISALKGEQQHLADLRKRQTGTKLKA